MAKNRDLTQYFKNGGKRRRSSHSEPEENFKESRNSKIFSKNQTQNKRSNDFRYDGRTHCSQMRSCEEAKFFCVIVLTLKWTLMAYLVKESGVPPFLKAY